MNNYSITFKSLRAGTVYTLNIGGGTGAAIPLKGGAQPFTTQEDDSDDMFTPIRTQTGYIRIVDDNRNANGDLIKPSAPTNWWKDLIPATDTSRPVTLTAVDSLGSNLGVVWQGFMQAQNFGGTLYGNPQEREFPVQCVLSVTQGTDINYQQKEIKNFAYLLTQIVNSIPSSQRPTNFMIQGGTDAQQWLLKKIDWQNFVSEDGDGNLTARYSMYQCLEDMCKFWGWTARTHGETLYLTMADDSTNESKWLSLSYDNLTTMAAEVAAGTTTDVFITTTLAGDIFASTNQNDYVQRGHNKATVTADAGDGDAGISLNIKGLIKLEHDQGWKSAIVNSKGEAVYITNDLSTFSFAFLGGSVRDTYGSFARMNIKATGGSDGSETSLIRIKKTAPANFGINNDAYVSLESVYHHGFGDGYIELFGDIYRNGDKFESHDNNALSGNKTMWMRLGIGKTRDSAYWWTQNTTGGGAWVGLTQPDVMYFKVTIGNSDNKFRVLTPGGTYVWIDKIPVDSNISGKIFVDFLGSSDLSDINNEKLFDISNFQLSFTRNEEDLDVWGVTKNERQNTKTYSYSNGNNVRNEWNADCIYASDNNMFFGYGVLMNADGSYFDGYEYSWSGGHKVYPEQYLCSRVTRYWQTSRRRLEVELLSSLIPNITPRYKISIDDTTGYPVAISRDWRDDVTKLTLMEI